MSEDQATCPPAKVAEQIIIILTKDSNGSTTVSVNGTGYSTTELVGELSRLQYSLLAKNETQQS